MRDHSEISFSSMDGVNVKLFFVDVAHIEEIFAYPDAIEKLWVL